MKEPIVSIITSSFNRGHIIGETAQSIFNQDCDSWEWCIVDDHSTDNTYDVIQKIASRDKRVKCFQRKGDKKGANYCRNQAVEATAGEYIIILDDDDLLEPFAIRQRLQVMRENPELDFAIFPSLLFREQPYDMNIIWNIDKPEHEIVRQFNQDPLCQGTGVLIKREAFVGIGMFDPTLLLWQDFDLFFKLYIQGYKYKKCLNLPPDLHIRHAENSLSRGNFFDYGKQMSRVEVIKNAVRMLKENNRREYIEKADSMFAEVFTALTRIGKRDDAANFLVWAIKEGVVSSAQGARLRTLINIYRYRLNKLGFIQKYIAGMLKEYQRPRTVATLPYK